MGLQLGLPRSVARRKIRVDRGAVSSVQVAVLAADRRRLALCAPPVAPRPGALSIRAQALSVLLLLCACGERTDLSYDEIVDEYREEHGPFLECGVDFADCETGARAAAACLASGIASCRSVEHVLVGLEDGETATTFVTPAGDSCEVIVLRDRGLGAVGTNYVQERCDSVEISDIPPCIRFRGCDVEKRWNRRP